MAKLSAITTPKLMFDEGAAAATPAANDVVIYAKADGKMYSKDDAGTETLMSSGLPTAAAFHGVRATATAGQAIANATLTALAFAATDRYDTDAYHDTSTNNTRITIPAGLGGYYRLGGQATLSSNSTTGFRALGIRINGTTYIALIEAEPGAGISSEQFISVSTEYNLVVGDYAELIYYQSSGGSLNLTINGSYGAQFWASLAGT